MGLKRKRILRVPIEDYSDISNLPPGWSVNIKFENGDVVDLDFSFFSRDGRAEIAQQFRDAIWSMRFSSTAASLTSYFMAIKNFWRFLDQAKENGTAIVHMALIDTEIIERFLSWLAMQTVPKGHKNQGKPLSFAHQRNTYGGIKTLLLNRQRLSPTCISPELSFPRNPFPNCNRSSSHHESYLQEDQQKLISSINSDLKLLHERGFDSLSPLQVQIVHLLAFGQVTGLNLQPLLELKRDSLRPHPLQDREILVTEKRRGWSTHSISIKSLDSAPRSVQKVDPIPQFLGDHIRALCKFTANFVDKAPQDLQSYIFLCPVSKGPRIDQVRRLTRQDTKAGLRNFVLRHGLRDSCGKPFPLTFARLRPTFGMELYRRTKDIRQVSTALGHASTQTTSRYYLSKSADAVRDHAIVLEAMCSSFSRTETPEGVIIAADGAIPIGELKNLLRTGYATGIAHCKNPFRSDESVCKKFFTCFKCPNMIVFEDDLWRLFSFYEKLLSERPKIRADHWLKTFGPIVRRIDEDIAPLFPADKVEEARQRAKQSPHPAWRK